MNTLKNIRILIIAILILSAPVYGFMLLYITSNPSIYAYGFLISFLILIGGIILSYKREAGWYIMIIGIILTVLCWQLDIRLQQKKAISSENALCEKLRNDPTCVFDERGGYNCGNIGSTSNPCNSINP